MEYRHTQTGWLHWLLYAAGGMILGGAWLTRADPAAAIILLITGLVIVLLTPAFRDMTVQDEGDCLAIRYGPLPLFRKRIPYAALTDAEPGRSSLIDGWGIHYVPGSGWTYNLWGFDCARLTVKGRTIRVGSDDVDNLVAFLKTRIRRPD